MCIMALEVGEIWHHQIVNNNRDIITMPANLSSKLLGKVRNETVLSQEENKSYAFYNNQRMQNAEMRNLHVSNS